MTGREGGPGTGDPGRVRYAVISLRFVVTEAFGEKGLRIVAPGWVDDDWFQIDATMPPATTEPQFRTMMQTLLAERFKLQYHRESKETAGFALVVGKGGPKFRKSAEAEPGEAPIRQRLITGTDRVEMNLHQTTMERLADILAGQIGNPVTDATGLTGKYDFRLNFSKEGAGPARGTGAEPVPDVFTAVQSELGLKLEPKKASIPVLVIDHIERTPTEN